MEANVIPDKVKLDGKFLDLLKLVHDRFSPSGRMLIKNRKEVLLEARAAGIKPDYLNTSVANIEPWKIRLPEWCQDQRNQMTGPADDRKLVVKLLNSGSPGVMLDLEDSMKNSPENLLVGLENIKKAYHGTLTYEKDGKNIEIKESDTVMFVRPRGMHVSQEVRGIKTIASIFDLCYLFYDMKFSKLSSDFKHPPCIYIPKSESAIEGAWWNELFTCIETLKDWPKNTIKCMALVESHPLAFQMEEFAYMLRNRIMGLNLGRWDYLASLFDFQYKEPDWIMPDRNTIPLDVPFFQNLRHRLALICHKRGMLAIGGMTALYPSRKDEELNKRALERLRIDKKNEASCGMDGAWTGHPDQNSIAVDAFPSKNQIDYLPDCKWTNPNLTKWKDVGTVSKQGTRGAIRACIRYRQGVADGRGASLLDGYMEDLATDRIYRILICQRIDRGIHTEEEVAEMFREETEKLGNAEYLVGCVATWALIRKRQFNPV